MAATGGADLPENELQRMVEGIVANFLKSGALPGFSGGAGGGSAGGGGFTPTSGMSTSMPSLPPPAAQTAPSMVSGAEAGAPVIASAATQAIDPQAPKNRFMRPAVVTMPMGPQPSEFFTELRPYAMGEAVAGGYSDFGPYSNPRMVPPSFLREQGPAMQLARLDAEDKRRQQQAEVDRAEADNAKMEQEAIARRRSGQQAGQAAMAANYMTGIAHQMMAVTPSADARLGSSMGMGASQLGVMMANPALAAGGAIFGGAMSVVGNAQDFAYQKLVEQAGLERPRYLAATMGVDLSSKGRLATEGRGMGFRDAETAYMLSQYASSVGVADMGGMENPLRYQTMGVGLGAQAFYMQSAAQGGGGTQSLADAQRGLGGLIGTGFQSGLRGDRLQELVTRIAGILEGFKERGMTLDRDSTNQFVADAMASGISGVRAAKGMQGMQGEASSLSQQLMAPYRQLGQAALMSYVGQRAGSDIEAAQMAEELEGDPEKLYGVLRSQGLSGDAQERFFSSLTGNTKEGKQYARGLNRGQVQNMPKLEFFGMDLLAGAGMQGSRMLAEADAKVAQKVQEDFIEALKGFTAVMARQGTRNAGLGTSMFSRAVMASSGALQQGVIEGTAAAGVGTVAAPFLGTAVGATGGFIHGVYDYLFGE